MSFTIILIIGIQSQILTRYYERSEVISNVFPHNHYEIASD
jgi:hypothetical protein